MESAAAPACLESALSTIYFMSTTAVVLKFYIIMSTQVWAMALLV